MYILILWCRVSVSSRESGLFSFDITYLLINCRAIPVLQGSDGPGSYNRSNTITAVLSVKASVC